MGSINFHSLLIHHTPLNSKQKHSEPTDHYQLLWHRKTQVPINLHYKKVSFSLLRTHSVASTTSVVLGLSSSPSGSGDLSVLLIVSVPMLLFYWITNFVLPGILSKNTSEEQQTADENLIEDKLRQ